MLPAGPLAKLALEPILGLAGNALLERLPDIKNAA